MCKAVRANSCVRDWYCWSFKSRLHLINFVKRCRWWGHPHFSAVPLKLHVKSCWYISAMQIQTWTSCAYADQNKIHMQSSCSICKRALDSFVNRCMYSSALYPHLCIHRQQRLTVQQTAPVRCRSIRPGHHSIVIEHLGFQHCVEAVLTDFCTHISKDTCQFIKINRVGMMLIPLSESRPFHSL